MRGIPEIMCCRILVSMWFFRTLTTRLKADGLHLPVEVLAVGSAAVPTRSTGALFLRKVLLFPYSRPGYP